MISHYMYPSHVFWSLMSISGPLGSSCVWLLWYPRSTFCNSCSPRTGLTASCHWSYSVYWMLCFLKLSSLWEFVSLFSFGNLWALSLVLLPHISSLCAVFLELLTDMCGSFLCYLSQWSHLSALLDYSYWFTFNLWYFLSFIFQFLQFL